MYFQMAAPQIPKTKQKTQQHSSTAHVFGAFRQSMPFGANAVDGGLNAGIEQFDHHDKNHGATQQGHFNPSLAQPKGGRNEKNGQQSFLPKGRFAPACFEACK
jgi:hypothetical protein